jgi:hypothetical protein
VPFNVKFPLKVKSWLSVFKYDEVDAKDALTAC